MQDLLKALKALSDETRLRILNILFQKECCVCEVMQALDISQTRASRNLGILQDAGFLKARRDGMWIVYSLDSDGSPHAVSLSRLIQNVGLTDEILALDKARLKQARRVGTVCLTDCQVRSASEN